MIHSFIGPDTEALFQSRVVRMGIPVDRDRSFRFIVTDPQGSPVGVSRC